MPSVEITSLRRFFITLPQAPASFPTPVALEDPFTVGHIRNVLRMKVDDTVVVIDRDRETPYLAQLQDIQKSRVTVSLLEALPVPAAALPSITLGVGMIKEQHWDWLLQKTVELGVRTIIPLQTQRSVIKVQDPVKKQARWQAVAQSAAEQSEGLFVPSLTPPMTLEAFYQQTADISCKLLLQERGSAPPLRDILRQQRTLPGNALTAAIGPEGGWTPAETEGLMAQGFQPVSLGARILRAETAAMALMSILTYEFYP